MRGGHKKKREQDSAEVKREMFQRSITSCITLASLRGRETSRFPPFIPPHPSPPSSPPHRLSDKHPFINVSVIQLNYSDIDKTRSDGR